MEESVEKSKAKAVTKELQIGDSFHMLRFALSKPQIPLELIAAVAVLPGATQFQMLDLRVIVKEIYRDFERIEQRDGVPQEPDLGQLLLVGGQLL